jgi:hypothetical protein
LQLNEELLNPVETLLVICNLGNKQCSLDFLKILHFLLGLPHTEFGNILLVHLLMEGELLDVYDDLRQSLRKAKDPPHEWVLVWIQDIDGLAAIFSVFTKGLVLTLSDGAEIPLEEV